MSCILKAHNAPDAFFPFVGYEVQVQPEPGRLLFLFFVFFPFVGYELSGLDSPTRLAAS